MQNVCAVTKEGTILNLAAQITALCCELSKVAFNCIKYCILYAAAKLFGLFSDD